MIKGMDLTDLALYVYEHLKKNGITAVLSGGGVVTVYSENKYQSRDLDFISPNEHKKISEVMALIGFTSKGKNFSHSDIEYTVEFPTGPLMVGSEFLGTQDEREVRGKMIRILSPTNSIKDRLAAYYHWNDMQSLRQAVQIFKEVGADLSDIEKWSLKENALDKYQHFMDLLK